jgi:hypothetical protein
MRTDGAGEEYLAVTGIALLQTDFACLQKLLKGNSGRFHGILGAE